MATDGTRKPCHLDWPGQPIPSLSIIKPFRVVDYLFEHHADRPPSELPVDSARGASSRRVITGATMLAADRPGQRMYVHFPMGDLSGGPTMMVYRDGEPTILPPRPKTCSACHAGDLQQWFTSKRGGRILCQDCFEGRRVKQLAKEGRR